LGIKVTGKQPADNLPGLFNEMSASVSAFNGVQWKDLGDQGVDIKI